MGGTSWTGIQVSVVAKLRQALGLDKPGEPVKVIEPYQMLGEVAADLQEVLGLDVVNLPSPTNMFGFQEHRLETVADVRRHKRSGAGQIQYRPEAEWRYLNVSGR